MSVSTEIKNQVTDSLNAIVERSTEKGPRYDQLPINGKRRMVMTLAAQLRKSNKSMSLSDSIRMAWSHCKGNTGHLLELLSFTKVSGENVTRVVMAGPAGDYVSFKGSGRMLKPGQRLFVDAGAYLEGAYCVRSYYPSL